MATLAGIKEKESVLSADQLKLVLRYEPETGLFIRLHGQRNRKGHVAGSTGVSGYVAITVGKFSYRAHRLAWLYINGEWPRDEIDHINGIRHDNRYANLRAVSRVGNLQNQRRAAAHNRTGLIGAHFNKATNKYVSRIGIGGKSVFLGYFSSPEGAHEAYVKAKRQLHPASTI